MRSTVFAFAFAGLVAASPLAGATPSEPPIGGNGGRGMAILRPCASAQLKATATAHAGTMPRAALPVRLVNVSANACAIDGFPAVRLLDELDHPQIVAESFSGTPRLFTIATGQAAEFLLRVATGDGVTPYRTVPTLAVIPPGDTTPIVLHVELPVAPTIGVTALVPAPFSEPAAPRRR